MKTIRNCKFHYREGTFDENILDGIGKNNEYGIKPKGAVVDIGAHIGVFCIPLANEGARVRAFEPAPQNFKLLKKNKEENDLDNLEIIQKGVGEAGEHNFTFKEQNTGNSGIDEQGDQTIDVISLEEALEGLDYVDAIKIDCEGAEYDMIDDLLANSNRIGKIVMELHQRDIKEFIKKLEQEYKVNKSPSNAKRHCIITAT